MEVTAEDKVLVAVRDDEACRSALEWCIQEFAGPRESSVCFLLTHVVTELRNTAGKVVKLSQADGPSVAVHICDRVLPYLEGLQDVCDDAQIPSTVHVIKNESKGVAILEAAKQLEATHIVLACVADKDDSQWHTINACFKEDALPAGCTCILVQDGAKLKSLSSAQERAPRAPPAAAAPAFHGTAYNKVVAKVDEAPSAAPAAQGAAAGEGDPAAAVEGDGEGAETSGLSALELARLQYRAANPKAAPTPAPVPPKPKPKAAKPTVAAKARLEKKMAEAQKDEAGKEKIPADQNPILKNTRLQAPGGGGTEAGAEGGESTPGDGAHEGSFQKYTLEELQAAMDHFWPNHVCGEGSYGVVYKGLLNGQCVAIKQLKNPDVKAALDEIEREVEVQKRIEHPNLVRLLGYCIEDRSLVYEFMSNGSLEDRLLCIGGAPPMLWPERCRIAMEVAAGLQHLHTRKPPIVHRDVKPANILLDDKNVAKLGDVGLARLMGDLAPGHSHVVRKSVIVGTEHYVDPEYLCARRGYLGPKSDVYSFGIVLLQMLVGEVPNLRKIDAAVEKEELKGMLDPRSGDWPMNLAMDLANLGLWCSEMDRRDRPDLTDEVIPSLTQICDAAAVEVLEFERKQAEEQERARKEAEAKEAAAKAEEARKLKQQQEAAAAAKAAEAQRAAAKAPPAPAAPLAKAAAAEEKAPACCTIL